MKRVHRMKLWLIKAMTRTTSRRVRTTRPCWTWWKSKRGPSDSETFRCWISWNSIQTWKRRIIPNSWMRCRRRRTWFRSSLTIRRIPLKRSLTTPMFSKLWIQSRPFSPSKVLSWTPETVPKPSQLSNCSHKHKISMTTWRIKIRRTCKQRPLLI